MALITCKECKSSISSKAKTCPSCGAPPKKKTHPLVKILAILIAVVVLPGYFVSLSKVDAGDESTLAYIKVENYVKANLRAPATAVFPGVLDGYTGHIKRNGQIYYIDSWVDSQNGFGATLRNHFTAEIEKTGSNSWQLNDLVMN
jgi:hypothetical protein